MVGAPHFLSITTLRPRGPSVTLTVSASLSTPRSSAERASELNSRILGIDCYLTLQILQTEVLLERGKGARPPRRPGALNHACDASFLLTSRRRRGRRGQRARGTPRPSTCPQCRRTCCTERRPRP